MVAPATLPTLRKGFPPSWIAPSVPSTPRPSLSRGGFCWRACPLIVPTLPPVVSGSVWFLGAPSSAGTPEQVVQQGGEAIVWLQRTTFTGPLQVQVATDPSSPAVGVNLPAVNQTVTIAGGQNVASVIIPTNVGAPNPGEVDVNLTITPIYPTANIAVQDSLELRILAPDATTPPMIIGEAKNPDGIVLMFSKPMNPVQASNVHNYKVRETWTTSSANDPVGATLFWFLSPDTPLGGVTVSKHAMTVPLRSAIYDQADFTVTLIPKRRLSALASESPVAPSFVVTPGTPAKTSARHRQGSSPAQGLTDLDGNAINQGGKPGKFRISVSGMLLPPD
jgi:hypothetical protein